MIFLIFWLSMSLITFIIYYVKSRKMPEYKSARQFEDVIAGICSLAWPITLPIILYIKWD